MTIHTANTTSPTNPTNRARRPSRGRRLLAAVGVLAAVAGTTVATAPTADAAAGCTPGGTYGGKRVYYCDVWSSGNIPIYASTSTASGVIDRLRVGGKANWFFCQQNGSTATVSGYTSKNWAKTVGDNAGRTGWVPAVYFAGAQNYWPNLPSCTGTPPPPPPTGASRAAVLARAKTWLTAWNGGPVPYSQSRYFQGYRQDCSGFVSMALSLGKPGTNTVGLTSSSITRRITPAQMKPGDLMIDAIGNSNTRHVVMFEKWANSAKSAYWVYEQAGDGGTKHRIQRYGLTSGSEYRAYRPLKFRD